MKTFPRTITRVVAMMCIGCVLQAAMGPYNLTVGEGFRNPIGFYDSTPVLSWKLPAETGVKNQTAYRIVVGAKREMLPDAGDLWDSGKVASDQSVWIPYGGKPLTSRQRVFWQVRFWDQDGNASDWSETASFELGLLQSADWRAQWIRMAPGADTANPQETEAKIVITKAVYGILSDLGKQADVTHAVQKHVSEGARVIEAGNTLGGDPAYGTVKELMLEYRVNGAVKRRRVREGERFDLVTGRSVSGSREFVPQYLRREFQFGASVAQARLYVTAKGLFEIHLNGKRVGPDCLVPGWTPYHKRIETLTYDVTELLKNGRNAIGAILAEGWYAGPMMSKKFVYPEAKPSLLCQLEITYSDGTAGTFISDETWKSTDEGPIRFSSIYHGENYDASLEMPGWDQIEFDDSQWHGVLVDGIEESDVLVPKRHSAAGVTQELPAGFVSEPRPGTFVFDLGQNMVGWPRLRIPVKKGRLITVRVAEMLNKDGTLYTANYRGARSTDHYTAAEDGVVTWSPTFTFHGFRYVELTGFPAEVRPDTGWVTGLVLHSRFASTGQFVSSHDKLNQLQSNIRWGQRGNFVDIPTDCPQRNERLGWTGDAQVFCPTSLFNYDVLAFWMSWLQSVREEQDANGLIDHVVPQTGCGSGSPGWGDVAVTVPWHVYVRTGYRVALSESYEMMKCWTAAYERQAKSFIVSRNGFGDWLQPYPQSKGNRADTPMDLIATAYFGHCVWIMKKTAEALGKTEDASRYAHVFSQIRDAFSEKFFDGRGRLKTQFATQTGYLMALGYDLLLPELRDGALKGLLEAIDEADGHLRTGFLGTPLIAPVLDRFGHTNKAYGVLFKETYPSWFFSINQGATTMWERWNSYSHKDGFGNAGMNSFNHYAYGAIGQWMYERIAGLAPDPEHPGYKHFFVQPLPGGPLTSASAELETPYGLAKSAWILQNDALQVTAIVPPNTTATLRVPSGWCDDDVSRTLRSGEHHITLERE